MAKKKINLEELPQVPVLTKETWELLEFRLWDKFKNKLWTVVGVFLTLVTIGGILGVNSYVNSRIETEINGEKDKLKKYQESLLIKERELVEYAILTNHLVHMMNNDRRIYFELLTICKQKLDSLNKGKNEPYLTSLFNSMEDFEIKGKDYPKLIVQLTDFLNGKQSVEFRKIKKDSLTESDWDRFDEGCKGFEEVRQLADIYPHLKSLNDAIDKSLAFQMKPYLTDPELKVKLYKSYEDNFGKLYQDEFKNYKARYLMMVSSGKFGWSSLPGQGKNAFLRQEYLISGDKAIF